MTRSLLTTVLALTLASTLSAQSDKIERGKYLAEEIGKCQDCHTPRLPTGELDTSKWMRGGVMNVQPINPIPKWHKDAPNITPTGSTWEKWKKEGIINYLVTGLNPRGNKADPPMATYKLKKEDAEAIVEYLETLK